MGQNASAKYVPKYPEGFNEKHTELDHGLSYFKNDLETANRSGKKGGIRERALNRKKLKGFEMGINSMAQMSVNAMSKKTSKFSEEDEARWKEMIDELSKLYKECKTLLDSGGKRSATKSQEEGTTADDFLRGDGGPKGNKSTARAGGGENQKYRTGKMSERERQAMQELNDKDEVMDDIAEQITENLEFLHMRAEMIGEEIDSQKELVNEVNDRAQKVKGRTHQLNEDIASTMEADGLQAKEKEKKGGMKKKMMGAMLKSAIS